MLKLISNITSTGSVKGLPTPSMQILEHIIVDRPADPETLVLAHKDAKLYVASHKGSLSKSAVETANPSTWLDPATCVPPQEVCLQNIYPAHQALFTRYVYPGDMEMTADVYVKRVNVLDIVYHHGMSSLTKPRTSQLVVREAFVCELLRRNPHRNIAVYKGVLTGMQLTYFYRGLPVQIPMPTERVLGLVFQRYDCTLYDLVMRRQDIDVQRCLTSIALGIHHLHTLGLVHCDIKPKNIFVRRYGHARRDLFVVGDFDSAQVVGSVLKLKGGDLKWSRRKVLGRDVAEREDDWYAFERLKTWLCREVGEDAGEYAEIGRWG
ncbi:hypothetical protein P153DRAFT_386527 [Dothidotthia symphoricarpi CBS 119687]|uniref:Protein kinase domain-containing protein n=1 Tax=Dothidotthia symphoricarpi CBS 119687 TaxID=1392245 RepID=A0A6A6AB74_9PLEO|nr:uncharacterized protein P153DRAFT_386527 [Dothidotthia symphoricarpi CBS 119687]KAF2128405.1 hypothetical protein P153DRAFT_386527 [Dothidotthia symphoricarpi CBS 119687]